MKITSGYTVSLRKISSGHKITSFLIESLDDGRAIALTLVNSQAYNRCFAVALDWQGETCFSIFPQGSENAQPNPVAAPVPPQFQQYTEQYRQLPPQQVQVQARQVYEPAAPPPGANRFLLNPKR